MEGPPKNMRFLGPLKHMRFLEGMNTSGSYKTHEVLKGENLDLGPSNPMRFLGPPKHMSFLGPPKDMRFQKDKHKKHC